VQQTVAVAPPMPRSCVALFSDFLLPRVAVVLAARDTVALMHDGDAASCRIETVDGDVSAIAAASEDFVVARGLGFASGSWTHLRRGVVDREDTHAATVLAVDVDATGTIATSCADGAIGIWRPDTMGPPLVLSHGHADWVRFVRFFTDGLGKVLLVSGGDDGRLCVWDALGAALLHRERLPCRCVRSLATNGTEVAVAGDEPLIYIVRWSGSKLIQDREIRAHETTLSAMAMTEALLCSAGEDEIVMLHDLASGVCIAKCFAHQSRRCCVSFMTVISSVAIIAHPPQSSAIVVVSASSDGDVVVWTVRRGVSGGVVCHESKTQLLIGPIVALATAAVT
jgi:WD40 repeat protein